MHARFCIMKWKKIQIVVLWLTWIRFYSKCQKRQHSCMCGSQSTFHRFGDDDITPQKTVSFPVNRFEFHWNADTKHFRFERWTIDLFWIFQRRKKIRSLFIWFGLLVLLSFNGIFQSKGVRIWSNSVKYTLKRVYATLSHWIYHAMMQSNKSKAVQLKVIWNSMIYSVVLVVCYFLY